MDLSARPGLTGFLVTAACLGIVTGIAMSRFQVEAEAADHRRLITAAGALALTLRDDVVALVMAPRTSAAYQDRRIALHRMLRTQRAERQLAMSVRIFAVLRQQPEISGGSATRAMEVPLASGIASPSLSLSADMHAAVETMCNTGTPTIVPTAGADSDMSLTVIAPVLDRDNQVVAAIAVTGDPSARINMVAGLRSNVVTSATIVLVVAVLCFYMLADRRRRRLQEFKHVSTRVVDGDISVRLARRYDDEFGTVIDAFNAVTARLEESHVARDYVKKIIENMIDPLFVLDENGVIRTVNQASIALLGYVESDLVGRKIVAVIPDLAIKTTHTRHVGLAALLKVGVLRDVETVALTSDGDRIPVSFSGSVMLDEDDAVAGLVCIAIDIRQRLENQAQLRRLATALESTGEAIMITDTRGKIEYVNRAFEKMTGYTRREAIGQLTRILKRCDGDGRYDQMLEAMEGEKTWYGSFLDRRKDGSFINLEESVAPVRDSGGNTLNYVAVVRDVTARRRAEAERSRLATALEATGEGIIITDVSGVIQYVNPAFERMTGFTSEESLGQNPRILNSGKENSELFRDMYAKLGRDEIWRGSYVNKRKDGTFFDVEETIAPVLDASGVKSNYVAVLRDITEQREVEKYIRSNEERFRAVVESAYDAIISTDSDGKIIFWNLAARTCFGYSSDDILGKTVTSIVPKRFAKKFNNRIGVYLSLDHGTVIGRSVELIGLRRDGTEFPMEVSLANWKTDEGMFVTAIARDITERNKAEHDLRTSKERLEEMHARLKENQAQLIQSEKLASLGLIAAGVAHEINNPVAYIMGNIDTLNDYVLHFQELFVMYDRLDGLLQGIDAPQVTALLQSISEAKSEKDLDFVLQDIGYLISESLEGTNRVKDIVQNLKSFARVDEAEQVEADINECIESTLRIVWNNLKYKCTVEKTLGALPKVLCQPGKLNQVFLNLLVNAAEAIPDKGVISILTECVGGHIIVRISDTGSGIEPEYVNSLFTPFFTTKPVGQGTGLGLSISYGIIQEHDGRIDVESQVGEGTTFTVSIPAITTGATS